MNQENENGPFPNSEDTIRCLSLLYAYHTEVLKLERKRARRLLKASRKKWNTHYRALRAKRKQAKLSP